ncbi:MAG: hypothetical protein KBC56_09340, partial [Flavobacterium sp.]|nr:hypothetical protein [Flavobacterium sp.]
LSPTAQMVLQLCGRVCRCLSLVTLTFLSQGYFFLYSLREKYLTATGSPPFNFTRAKRTGVANLSLEKPVYLDRLFFYIDSSLISKEDFCFIPFLLEYSSKFWLCNF